MAETWSEWQAAGDYANYRDARVFLRRGGVPEAPLLVLIHGFPTSSWDWHALWYALAARWRLLAPDLIGFGLSAKPRAYAYSIRDQASLIETLLDRAGEREYHVLAHDYGDSVAQELIARQADAGTRAVLRSVAFLNGGLFPETHRPLLTQRLLRSPLGPWLAPRMNRATLARSMRRIFGPDTPPDAAVLDGFWQGILHDDGRAVLPRLIRYIDERRAERARWVGALERTHVPLALIAGAADPISGAHMAARYRELVPHANVTELPGIGHYPQVEAPDAVLTAYFAFRARIAAGSA